MQRQQVLYLWLAEGALDTGTIARAFYDGTQGQVTLPSCEPPFANGVAALEAGWFTAISGPYLLSPVQSMVQGICPTNSYLCDQLRLKTRTATIIYANKVSVITSQT